MSITNKNFTKRLEELRQEYFTQLPARIESARRACTTLLAQQNANSISRLELQQLLHNLAGSAATFGIAYVGEAARRFEMAVKSLDHNEVTLYQQSRLLSCMADLDAALALVGAPQWSLTSHAEPVPLQGQGQKADGLEKLVFLVEDDPAFAAYVGLTLQQHSYTVRMFSNLQGLREAVMVASPMAILMDLVLPEGELAGLTLIPELDYVSNAPIPVIAVSARDDLETRLSAVRAGCVHYLTKPFEPTALLRILDELTLSQPTEPYRILVVDDDAMLAEAYQCELTQAGMQVAFTTDPHIALELQQTCHPELILMDVCMPFCSGLELATVLRQQESENPIPMVFLSTEANIDRQLAALDLEGDDFLSKPIAGWRLVRAVHARVKRARELRLARERLQESEARFRTMFEIASVGIVMVNLPDGQVLMANQKYCEINGYSATEILTKTVWELTHPNDLEFNQQVHAGIMRGEISRFCTDKRNVRKDGKVIWVRVNAAILRDNYNQKVYSIGVIEDITSQKEAQEARAALEHAVDRAIEGFALLDANGVYTYMNASHAFMYGFEPGELIGKSWRQLYGPEEIANIENKYFPLLQSRGYWSGELVGRKKDGIPFTAEISLTLLDSHITQRHVLICNCRDISARKYAEDALRRAHDNLEQHVQERTLELTEANRQLTHLATHDALTGLINRFEFERRLQRVLESTEPLHTHVVLYLDLDQFKVINDTCGHIAGDELLRQLSGMLMTCVRQRDTLARLGGDEFGVLLEHCPMEQGLRIAEELLKAIEDFQFTWQGKGFWIGASIGLVPFSATGETLADIQTAADHACYVAKDKGRHRVHIYTPTDTELARRAGEMRWVPRLRQALARNYFLLYAQPVVTLNKQDKYAGFEYHEILLRLSDSEAEPLLPGAFIPSAERYQQITALDRWVVHATMTTIATYGYSDRYAINVSGQSLGDRDFLAYVIEQFEHTGVAPKQICFEITETAAITEITQALAFITALKSRGCRFALDDFGSGLSSFGYLKTLPVDYLKIDGRFIKDILTDTIDRAMVQAIQQVARTLGIKTIAESVETDAICEQLREIGIDFGQGYTFAYPQPIEQMCMSRA